MDIVFGLLGLVILGGIVVGSLMLLLFCAKKMGLVPESGFASASGKVSPLLNILAQSLITRFALVALLSLLMVIPLNMVEEIVDDRSALHRSVLNDIANTWGRQQQLSGPALMVPYTEKFITESILTDKDGNERKVNKTRFEQRTAIVLPESLTIDTDLKGHERSRGIYNALVYSANLKINGSFKRPNINSLSNHIDTIHWDKAWFVLGISDTRAINKVSALKWAKQAIDFEPGTKITGLIKQGFHAPLVLNDDQQTFPYFLDINLNGSNGFYFEPFAKKTEVTISSDWPHPSFQGSVLPSDRTITDKGFEASWSVPNLARNYPQLWTAETQQFNVHEFRAGVHLFEPISLYSQITRTIKYGILFIVLTYITFVIFELGIKQRLHFVQYGIIGLGLSLFYLSLLALAEHISFLIAYVSAASLISLMISLYVYSAVKNISRTGLVFLLLSGLYSILYSLLKLEGYALLVGTLLLLVILAVLMYFTRHIGSQRLTVDNDVTKTEQLKDA